MLRWILGVYFAVMLSVVVANVLYMIVSPRAWFRLPKWIRLNGTLTEESHESGWGAVQVRLLGAIFLVALAWIVCRWH